MRVLALDTASDRCAVLLADVAGAEVSLLALRDDARRRGHADVVVPMVDAVMGEAGVALSDVDRFAATVGPGTYTGIRAAVAAVRGFALAMARPAVGISCLEVHGVAEAGRLGAPVLAVLPGRGGDVFAQAWDTDGRALTAPLIGQPPDLAARLPSPVRHVTGPGADVWLQAVSADPDGPATIRAPSADLPLDLPTLARLSAAADPDQAPAEPLYLKSPDAAPQAHKALPRV